MKMNQRQLEKMIGKMINVIKPNGVSFIEFKLDPLDIHGNEYYMDVEYVVPDDSEFLKINPFEVSKPSRYYWNNQIIKTIKTYFDVNVIINNSSIISESYYNRLKDN
jgi:hypothetical protein